MNRNHPKTCQGCRWVKATEKNKQEPIWEELTPPDDGQSVSAPNPYRGVTHWVTKKVVNLDCAMPDQNNAYDGDPSVGTFIDGNLEIWNTGCENYLPRVEVDKDQEIPVGSSWGETKIILKPDKNGGIFVDLPHEYIELDPQAEEQLLNLLMNRMAVRYMAGEK